MPRVNKKLLAVQVIAAVVAFMPLYFLAEWIMSEHIIEWAGWRDHTYMVPYVITWCAIIGVGEIIIVAAARKWGQIYFSRG